MAIKDVLPRVLASYPVIYSDKASGFKALKESKEDKWILTGMNDLKEIKHAMVTYGLHSHLLKKG